MEELYKKHISEFSYTSKNNFGSQLLSNMGQTKDNILMVLAGFLLRVGNQQMSPATPLDDIVVNLK